MPDHLSPRERAPTPRYFYSLANLHIIIYRSKISRLGGRGMLSTLLYSPERRPNENAIINDNSVLIITRKKLVSSSHARTGEFPGEPMKRRETVQYHFLGVSSRCILGIQSLPENRQATPALQQLNSNRIPSACPVGASRTKPADRVLNDFFN